MKKRFFLLMPAFFASSAFAVDCQFVPLAVKAGAYNAKENNLLACSDAAAGICYNLGMANDDQAKNRYSAALTALASGKSIRLRFPWVATCSDAVTNFPVPNETILFN
jgi:hypothetical protein